MKFDAYEYIGLIIPGTIIIVALTKIFPEFNSELRGSLSIGDFGLVMILSYVAGHLVQAIGNLFEQIIWWFSGGMPTTWPAQKKGTLLTLVQEERLEILLKSDFNTTLESLKDGQGVMRELFVKIRRDGNIERIETFNRSYGLLRGIAAAFLIASILTIIKEPANWHIYTILFCACIISTYRMKRFGKHYAREVFAEYLCIGKTKN